MISAGFFCSRVAVATLLLSAPAMAEDLFASQSARSTASAARLLSAGPAREGVYRAGVEITLDPNTITYWRSPGEAGSPPVFDFAASKNVASVEPLYPLAKHILEEGSLVAGYDARVVFPLRVKPRDPAAPVTLDLTLDYAACGKICLPAKAHVALALPAVGASPYADTIAAAERAVPRRLTDAEAKKLIAIERVKGASASWRLRYLGKSRLSDVFVEVAEPLFAESKAGEGGAFEIKLISATGGAPPPGPAAATVTLATEEGAVEAAARLE